ncbi:MAG TPA: zinc-ribbon domain-containing protein [Terriglobales bacterium]|jgi:uncharacterized membrane protein
MAFCANCGSSVTDGAAFCAGCGKPVGTAPQASVIAQTAAGDAQAALAQPAFASAQSVSSGLTSNVAAALSYVLGLISGIIFLVLEPYKRERFVRFHAMQSILFCVAAIVFSIAWSILVNIMISISGWTAVALTPIGLVISLGFFLFWLFLMYQAYSQREFRVPVIGAIAAKQLG